jgi:hypothetical protein
VLFRQRKKPVWIGGGYQELPDRTNRRTSTNQTPPGEAAINAGVNDAERAATKVRESAGSRATAWTLMAPSSPETSLQN